MSKSIITALALASLCALSHAAPAQLITNGDFETGTFAGWTTLARPGSSRPSYFIDAPGTTSPVSGFATAPNALGGAFYAVTDQTGPGTYVLLQNFTVDAGSPSVILSFQMFANDRSNVGPIVNPAGLTHTAGANQHARVDILSAVAGDFDTGATVLGNFYLSVDPGVDPNPYTSYSFDITALVGAGGNFRLRFAEVDNQSFFQHGVDNVSILAEVPTPGTLALVGLPLLAAGMLRRRRV
jgi:hypothetical protein